MEIEIKGKKFEVKELPYIDAVSLDTENKEILVRTLFSKCLGMTDEEINSLSIADGRIAEKAIAEKNSINFQNPTEE